MMWDFRPGRNRFAGIVLQEYDHAPRRLVGPMTTILAKEVLTEGPNLYKRDGWYYLMLAEGGTGWNHGISMARSRTITGPYELDPQTSVLTTRDAPDCPLQKAGHGELVETPEGEWYLVHLASRPLGTGDARRCMLGRETNLQQVRWSDDGWLRLAVGNDPIVGGVPSPREIAASQLVALRGGGTPPTCPQISVPPPRGVVAQPWAAQPMRDDFDAPQLALSWSSLRGPVHKSWLSLADRPGWLRLRGRESLFSLFNQSLVARRITEHRCTAQTYLEFQPDHFTQMAGLVCYYDTRAHFYLRVTHDEMRGRVLGVVQTDDGAYAEHADSVISVEGWLGYHLKAEIDGARLQFSVSHEGDAWRPVGPELDASKLSDDYGQGLHFTGAFVGLCAQDLGGTGALADYSHFDLAFIKSPR
jgi:xylan 1,4-beta-xylosidase